MSNQTAKKYGPGCQINLDNGEGHIISGFVEDSIHAVSSYLEITFESSYKLLFGASTDYYFTFLNLDWVPLSTDERAGIELQWQYELRCLPRCVFMLITKPSKNTQELARALGLNLTKISSNVELPCPIINQYAGNVIQENRKYSLEKAYNERDLGKANYIYVNSRNMYSTSWKNMASQTAVTLTFSKGTEGTNLVTYQDYQFDDIFSNGYCAKVWTQWDYLGRMMGTQFKIETTVPAVFLNVYTIKLEEIPEFDTGLPFLCVYSKRDIMNINAFTHCFANIKFM